MAGKKGALDLDQVYVDKKDYTIYDPKVPRTSPVRDLDNLGVAAGSGRTVTSKDYPSEEKKLRKIYGTDFDKYSRHDQYEMKRRMSSDYSSAPSAAKSGSGGGYPKRTAR